MDEIITFAKAIALVWVFGVGLATISWIRGAITLYRHHWDGFLTVWRESEGVLNRVVLVAFAPFALPWFTTSEKEIFNHVE